MNKEYQHENVHYKFNKNFRKWLFQRGDFRLIQTCKGVETAHKVAKIVAGAGKRNADGLDGMARANISKLGI